MKLWVKLSLICIILFVIMLSICNYLVLIKAGQNDIDRNAQSALNEHYFVCSNLIRTIGEVSAGNTTETAKSSLCQYVFTEYASSYSAVNSELAIAKNGVMLKNTSKYNFTSEFNLSDDAGRQYIIKDINGRTILCVMGEVPMLDEYYEIYLTKDITEIFENISQLTTTVTVINAVCIAALAGILIFIVRLTLNPLRQLNSAAKSIAQGSYEKRVRSMPEDEVGDLAGSFNAMAEAVQQHVQELELTAEKRRLFMANLTHELKTPMTSIIGYSETLMKVKISEQQKQRAVSHIYTECRRVERLSQKLMRLLSADTREAIVLGTQNVKELFEAARESIRLLLEDKNIKLKASVGFETLDADADLFLSLLINLIENAVKASEPGSVIEILAYIDTRKQKVIEVNDTGAGIAPEEIGKITEPFYMVDKFRSARKSGFGIGLALCSAIARLHHAELKIESTPGRGASVRVIFGQEKL